MSLRLFSLQCFSHFADLLATVPLATQYNWYYEVLRDLKVNDISSPDLISLIYLGLCSYLQSPHHRGTALCRPVGVSYSFPFESVCNKMVLWLNGRQ